MVRLSAVLSLVSSTASSISLSRVALEPRARADHADLHAVLVQVGEIAADEAAHQPEQIVDLLPRPRPVLRGEAEQSEMGDTKLERGLDRAPHAFDALTMTLGARQAALGGPAAIAVHDDRDMAGNGPVGRVDQASSSIASVTVRLLRLGVR